MHSEKENYWQAEVNSWKESGMVAIQFCRQKKISYQRFLFWRRLLLKNVDGFVELKVEESPLVELRCGDISLQLKSDLGPQSLSVIIYSLHKAAQLC